MSKRRTENGGESGHPEPLSRVEIDAAVSGRIKEFRHHLGRHKESPADVLRFAARCAERARGIHLPPEGPAGIPDLVGLVQDATDFAVRAGYSAADGEIARDPPAERVRSALEDEELLLYRGDAKAPAVLELARVAFRLLGAVGAHPGDPHMLLREAASTAAHAITAVRYAAGDEPADRLETAALADLRAFPWEGEAFPPLWTGRRPAWAAAADTARPLTTASERVQSRLVAKREQPRPTNEPKLEAAHLPPSADPRDALAHAELHITEVRRAGLARLQSLLETLTGKSLGSYEENKLMSERVSKLVTALGAVLLLSGEYENRKGETKVYTLQPVKVRCDHPNVVSFKVLTAGRPSNYVTSTTTWPRLYAELV
jgi:hypothetical protein